MARFSVYAQRIQTFEYEVDADSYEEARRIVVENERLNLVRTEYSEWSYDVDEMGSLG
jgi:hypothetical protein